MTGWDSGLLSVSKWSQNDYHFFSHGLRFVGCSPLVSLPSLFEYLLLNFRSQLKYYFLKKAFSDCTVKPDSLQHILIKFPSFIIVPTVYHYVLDEGSHPGDICLCWETVFIITTGRAGANSMKRSSVQFSSVQSLSCVRLCDPMNCSTPGLPIHHQLLEFTQTHVHRVCDIIQPSHPLSSPSPPAPNPSQHQSLFQRVNSSHEVAVSTGVSALASVLPKNTQD